MELLFPVSHYCRGDHSASCGCSAAHALLPSFLPKTSATLSSRTCWQGERASSEIKGFWVLPPAYSVLNQKKKKYCFKLFPPADAHHVAALSSPRARGGSWPAGGRQPQWRSARRDADPVAEKPPAWFHGKITFFHISVFAFCLSIYCSVFFCCCF